MINASFSSFTPLSDDLNILKSIKEERDVIYSEMQTLIAEKKIVAPEKEQRDEDLRRQKMTHTLAVTGKQVI